MHELNFNNGKASMMYVGDAPWHNLGVKLDQPATAEEAVISAGLDYAVVKKPLHAVINKRQHVLVANNFATLRTDTNQVLGVVGERYTVLQNREAFTFFDALTGTGEAIYETAGALGNGERIWILAKLPGYIKVHGKDIVNKYLLLCNSHDGSSLVRAKLTPIRVVCKNTLSLALSGTEEVRIRHTPSSVEKLEEAHKLLGLTNQLYEQLDFIFNRMALKKVTDKQLLEYIKKLIPSTDAENQTRTENIRSKILELHESGQGANLGRGTLWGGYNAVTEYTDHILHSRDQSRRLHSAWFGGGERLKMKAFELASSMLN
jgi:phage/plasmid-like protein (TIGR03299 family)